MTDDTIPRLRFRAEYADYPSDAEAFSDAADEIERLRAELAAMRELLREAQFECPWGLQSRIDAALKGDGE